jgi:pyruvate kinase
MQLRTHKTKIICTVGPASSSREVLERLIAGGMEVARLNFSHGDSGTHRSYIETVRRAAESAGRPVALLGDLPGPKIRIGRVDGEPVELAVGDRLILTTDQGADGAARIAVNFPGLPQAVQKGDNLYLNDGLVHIEVVRVDGSDVHCLVRAGGELRSHKGLNFPGISLGISAFTEEDRKWLRFARDEELDAVSQSFVESAADIEAVRRAAADMGYDPFVIAKIERADALNNIDAILEVSDAMMIARGDLGVEVPIQRIAAIQKELIRKANELGKPVITATQMLESMTASRRPTRAEVTDVANAILDGTDCVMLSGESAIGRYPAASVRMLAGIAAATEPLSVTPMREERQPEEVNDICLRDFVAWNVGMTLRRLSAALVLVPTRSGATARSIARFRPRVWIAAVSSRRATCRSLHFSSGVHPIHDPGHPDDWKEYARQCLRELGLHGDIVLLTEGPSEKHPDANHRLEMIDLRDIREKGESG